MKDHLSTRPGLCSEPVLTDHILSQNTICKYSEPVYNKHPLDQVMVVSVDRWSLYRGTLVSLRWSMEQPTVVSIDR